MFPRFSLFIATWSHHSPPNSTLSMLPSVFSGVVRTSPEKSHTYTRERLPPGGLQIPPPPPSPCLEFTSRDFNSNEPNGVPYHSRHGLLLTHHVSPRHYPTVPRVIEAANQPIVSGAALKAEADGKESAFTMAQATHGTMNKAATDIGLSPRLVSRCG